jgi:TPR repeat protein
MQVATVIAALSAIIAVIAAVIASRNARAAMKSAYAVRMSAQKKYSGMLPPPITITAIKKIDWARYIIRAIDTPFATVLTILFSIALGVGLNLLLSRNHSSSAPVSASNKPTVQASTGSVSPPLPRTSAAAMQASPPSVSAPPPPTSTTAAVDQTEAASLLARGRAYLSDGDVALARVFLRRAAERDDTQAALALGETYDPAKLRRLGIPNFEAQADLAKAREWYRRAAELGSADAALRLDQLSKANR